MDRAAWRAVLHWPDDCEQAFTQTNTGTSAGLTFHELSADISLVEVVCAAGAYQASFAYQRLDERRYPATVTLLNFPTYTTADGMSLRKSRETLLWGEPTFMPASTQLTVLSVSRQLRDCGTWARYSFPQGMPRLEEFRIKLPCPAEPGPAAESVHGQPPVDWPQIELR